LGYLLKLKTFANVMEIEGNPDEIAYAQVKEYSVFTVKSVSNGHP